MKKFSTNLALVILLFATAEVFSAMPRKVVVLGKVRAISRDVVTLNVEGKRVKVPKKSLHVFGKSKLKRGVWAKSHITLLKLKQLNKKR